MKRGQKLSINKWEKEHKTLIRNIAIFIEKLDDVENAEFIDSLLVKYQHTKTSSMHLSLEMTFLRPFQQVYEYSRRLKMVKEYYKNTDENLVKNIYNDVNNLLKKFDLGLEWRDSIAVLLLSGIMTVPNQNFYLVPADESINASPNRVVVVLNSDTTHDEIKKGFSIINAEQKRRRHKEYPITTKSLANRRINLLRSSYARRQAAIKSMIDAMSLYDLATFRDNSIPLGKKILKVNEFRKKRELKPIKFRPSLSVREMVKQFLPEIKPTEIDRLLVSTRQDVSRRKKRDKM